MEGLRVTLVGIGLLGGSLGLAIKKRQLAARVWGYVRREASIEECTRLGAVDHATCDLSEAVEGADLVILGTPLAQMAELTRRLAPMLKPQALVTDVGSVKRPVVEALEPLVKNAGATFIGSHPMAGAERMGVGAARADLFEGAVSVVTPTHQSPKESVARLCEFWTAVGCKPLVLPPEIHDELVSRSSHLPHVVASALAISVLNPQYPREQALLCASGFRDATRIASGSPEMWHDIVMANRGHLCAALDLFIEGLNRFRHTLETADSAGISEFFINAKQRRDAWCERACSPE